MEIVKKKIINMVYYEIVTTVRKICGMPYVKFK